MDLDETRDGNVACARTVGPSPVCGNVKQLEPKTAERRHCDNSRATLQVDL